MNSKMVKDDFVEDQVYLKDFVCCGFMSYMLDGVFGKAQYEIQCLLVDERFFKT